MVRRSNSGLLSVRVFLRILTISAAVFIGVAMVQQWQVFASAWFGYRPEVPTLSADDREETEKSLRHYLTLTSHLYRSNGDPRFLERMPAAPPVTDELMTDIVYLRHNGRYQEPTMERLVVEEAQLLVPGQVEILTREFWIIRTRSLDDGAETDSVRSQVIDARYRMSKEPSGWIVQAWQLVPGERTQGGGRRSNLPDENHEFDAKAQRGNDAEVLGQ